MEHRMLNENAQFITSDQDEIRVFSTEITMTINSGGCFPVNPLKLGRKSIEPLNYKSCQKRQTIQSFMLHLQIWIFLLKIYLTFTLFYTS